MNKDIDCPYCNHEQDINHDDGFGYEENTAHEMECKSCGKSFVFHTSVIYNYEPQKADCLNGKEHKWVKVEHYPDMWEKWERCTDCEAERGG